MQRHDTGKENIDKSFPISILLQLIEGGDMQEQTKQMLSTIVMGSGKTTQEIADALQKLSMRILKEPDLSEFFQQQTQTHTGYYCQIFPDSYEHVIQKKISSKECQDHLPSSVILKVYEISKQLATAQDDEQILTLADGFITLLYTFAEDAFLSGYETRQKDEVYAQIRQNIFGSLEKAMAQFLVDTITTLPKEQQIGFTLCAQYLTETLATFKHEAAKEIHCPPLPPDADQAIYKALSKAAFCWDHAGGLDVEAVQELANSLSSQLANIVNRSTLTNTD